MIAETLTGALFAPRRQMDVARRRQPLGSILAIYLLAGFSWVLSDFIAHGKTRVPAALLGDTIVYLSLMTVKLAMGAMLFHFFAELMGGRGRPGPFFWGMAQSVAPLVLLVPLALAVGPLGRMSGVVYFPGKLAIFAWVLVCQIAAISEAYGISVPRSCFVFFLTCGATISSFLALSVLLPLALLAKLSMIAG